MSLLLVPRPCSESEHSYGSSSHHVVGGVVLCVLFVLFDFFLRGLNFSFSFRLQFLLELRGNVSLNQLLNILRGFQGKNLLKGGVVLSG